MRVDAFASSPAHSWGMEMSPEAFNSCPLLCHLCFQPAGVFSTRLLSCQICLVSFEMRKQVSGSRKPPGLCQHRKTSLCSQEEVRLDLSSSLFAQWEPLSLGCAVWPFRLHH